MDLFNKTPMTWNNKIYEIRVLYDDRKINVVTFQNNHPVNGFRHQILLPKKCDVARILAHDILSEMIEISKNDIIENRWEKIAETIQTSATNT